MCIVLYVKLIWCSSIQGMYAQLTGGWGWSICFWFICALSYMWNLFGVVVFKACMIDWLGVHLPCVYVHCAISARADTFGVVVFKASMLNWLGVHLPLVDMCILLYVKLIWCNGLVCSYGWLTRGSICLQFICALSFMWNLFGVVVCKACMIDCLGGPSVMHICALCYIC